MMEQKRMRMSECDLRFFYRLCDREKKCVIDWCQGKGLIGSLYLCPKCGKQMKLFERKDVNDGYEWRCRVRGTHDVKRSIRRGTCFSASKLSLCDALLLTRMWFLKHSSQSIMTELGAGSRTVCDWKNFCREICMDLCVKESKQLGGPGVTVEIDETTFGERKFNLSSSIDGQWVFGGIERKSNRCFFRVVDDCTKENLLQVIREFVLPGSLVISDCWKAYECHFDIDFEQLKLNHSLEFKDAETKACMKNSEGTWSGIKRSLSVTKHVKGQFDAYLAEFMWRRSHNHSMTDEVFLDFLSGVRDLYPPQERDE